ncbi:pyridoxamine 5'-phosphate oxidase family protein [Candidatus Fermentibacterales bacterium]|nr:pyridoxamine 5'-phosphate oxidase family protein [Candidatus Fermentibacterales bacterium]
MRRAELGITSGSRMEDILRSCIVCRLGLCCNGQPYVVPLCYGYEDGSLYIHCAPEGRKLEAIRANDRVCFEVEEIAELERTGDGACDWDMRYRSLIGFGRATILTSREDRLHAAKVLLGHLASARGVTVDPGDMDVSGMLAIRVEVDSMTGRQSERQSS